MSKLLNALPTFLLFVILSFHLSFSAAANKQDLKALIAFKNYLSPGSLPAWDTSSTDYCSWDYITCSKSGRVTQLIIQFDSNIKGTIPPSIGDLSELQYLDFTDLPGLSGPIPRAITKLKKLVTFRITGSTSVSGSIPSFLSEILSLDAINFSNGKLSGTIPYSLGTLPKLTYLALSGDKITGTIPPNLFSRSYKLPNIVLLLNCKLTGQIPQTFRKISFTEIDLSGNELVGDASLLFGKSKPTDYLVLSNNHFSFNLTNVEYPKNLRAFSIAHNEIYGSISEQVTTIAKGLSNFDVSYNKLCGKIPRGGNFGPFDKSFFVHNRCLCGTPLRPCK